MSLSPRRAKLRRWAWRLRKPLRNVGEAGAVRLFGVDEVADTEGLVLLEDLGVAAPGRVQYQPSGNSWLWRALRGMPISPSDVFVDYGAGKGRVVLQAALRYPFRRVLGVEIAEELARVARSNVSLLAHRFRAAEVEIIVADATEWPLPDDVTFVYMYRPVKGELFERTMERIAESLDRRSRRLTLAYAYPEQEEVVLRHGFVRVRQSRGLQRTPQHTVSVYVRD
jgi:SAM-dependent methyltransferase